MKEIKNASSEENIKNAIINFTSEFNKMDDIESIEREDIYTSLCILMKNSPIKIEHDIWLKWFDETRNF